MPRSPRTNATQTSQSNEPHRTSLLFTRAWMRRPDARGQSERERPLTENKDPKPKKHHPRNAILIESEKRLHSTKTRQQPR